MAAGDIIWFEEARTLDYFAGWALTDDIKCAVLDNTTAPTAATATPALADFTEVGVAGSYTAGGTSLGNWGTVWSEAVVPVRWILPRTLHGLRTHLMTPMLTGD